MRKIFKTLALGSVAAVAFFPGLATADDAPAKIEKVKMTQVDFTKRYETDDPMLAFERRHLLYGAITTKEYYARAGKYYTVFWETKDKRPGVVVRFEYLQAKTGDKIKVKEVTVDHVKRNNTTDINVIGDEYLGDGNVIAWRASIVRDGQVIATEESFLWD
jgi:hypothetical protein